MLIVKYEIMLITLRLGKEIPRTMLSIFCLFFVFPVSLLCVFVHNPLVGDKVEGERLPGQGRCRGVDPWDFFRSASWLYYTYQPT